MPGLDTMKKRLSFIGGDVDERFNKNKLLSFQAALKNSYQAEWITFKENRIRCLINPDNLKEDYDQKILSVDYSAKIKEGDVFYWERTDSHWITYLQQHTEEAYFRANIRKCNYSLDIGRHKYWVYVRGPVETDIRWNLKENISYNDLNYTLVFYITKNEETLGHFQRAKIIRFDNANWEVQAVDRYSQQGIIEVHLREYFSNEMEDNMTKPEAEKPNKKLPYIEGAAAIDVYSENNVYHAVNITDGTFVVNSSKIKINQTDENSCTINVLTGKSTEFKLSYMVDDEEVTSLDIRVESF